MTARLEPGGLRRCFSTLGCVELSFPGICELAAEFEIPGIELRGISGRMDMPQCCAEQGLSPEKIQEVCQRCRTQLLVAGSSLKLTGASEKERNELVEICGWADALRIPYVRVFGGGTWGKPLTDADYTRAREFVAWWRKEQAAHNWRVELLL